MKASPILFSLSSLMLTVACGGEASLGDMDGGSTSSSTSAGPTGATSGSSTATGSTSGSTAGGASGSTSGSTSGSGGSTGTTGGATATTAGGAGGKTTTTTTTTGGGAGGSSGGAGGGATSDGGQPLCTLKCALGTHCVIETVQCPPPPSPCPGLGVAHCVPDTTVMCGGIAGTKCPGAGTCVNDPTVCDPKMTADCAGFCECAATKCVAGSHFDMSPSVCSCVPD